jgi:hypothetical protein
LNFEAPGADLITPYNGTFPTSLNDFGAITGGYVDGNDVNHGFLRALNGKMLTFDAPGADMTAGAYNGTFPESINFFGAVTGYVIDEKHVVHGWVRGSDGKMKTFDAPGADLTAGAYHGTIPFSNNAEGAITGYYIDINGAVHGFVRLP